MGLFDGVLSVFKAPDPLVAWREQTDDDALQAERAKVFLGRLGETVKISSADIRSYHPTSTEVELRGEVESMPLYMKIRSDGDVDDLKLTYSAALWPMDVSFDRNAKKNEVPEEDEEERRYFHGPDVYVDGKSGEVEFRALPDELRREIIETMRLQRIRWIRSSKDEVEITMVDHVNKEHSIERVASAIALAIKLTRVRIVLHHRKPKAMQRSKDDIEGFGSLRGMAFGRGNEKMVKVDDFVEGVLAKVPAARIVDRDEEQRTEIRWTEGNVPTRVAVEIREDSFPTVTAGVRLQGVSSAFALNFDPLVRASSEDEDGWAESERKVFFDKTVFVSSATTSDDAAFLQSLPPDALLALVELCKSAQQSIVLEEQVLSMDVGLLFDHADGARAIHAATTLAKAGARIPLGSPTKGTLAIPVCCAYCKAHFFRTATDGNCKHCGAPS